MSQTNESPVSLAASGALCLADPSQGGIAAEIVAPDDLWCDICGRGLDRREGTNNGDRWAHYSCIAEWCDERL